MRNTITFGSVKCRDRLCDLLDISRGTASILEALEYASEANGTSPESGAFRMMADSLMDAVTALETVLGEEASTTTGGTKASVARFLGELESTARLDSAELGTANHCLKSFRDDVLSRELDTEVAGVLLDHVIKAVGHAEDHMEALMSMAHDLREELS